MISNEWAQVLENLALDQPHRRLLWPNAELEGGTPEALRQIQDKLCEHLGLLQQYAPELELPEFSFKFTHIARVASDTFVSQWKVPDSFTDTNWLIYRKAVSSAWARCYKHIGEERAEYVRKHRLAFIQKVGRNLVTKLWNDRKIPIHVCDGLYQLLPGAASIANHAIWTWAFQNEPITSHPSPWLPLWQVWMMGVWPMVIPPSTMLVYVPVRTSRRIIFDPEFPRKTALPRSKEKREALVPQAHLGFLDELGFALAPGLDYYATQ